MTKSRVRTTIGVALGAGFLLIVGAAVATPGAGVSSAEVKARGTLEPTAGGNLIVNSKSGVHIKTQGSVDLVTQEIVIGSGGHTGWHSHPGPVLVTVKTGSLKFIDAEDEACVGTVYDQGESFIDRGDEHVHIARAGSAGVVLWATYFVPGTPGSTAFRLDEPAPGTGC